LRPVTRDAVVLADPARRGSGRRRFDPQDFIPPLDSLLDVLGGYGLIPALKGIIATLQNDRAWLRVRAPLVALSDAEFARLAAQIGVYGIDRANALAFSAVYHVTQFLPITLTGLYYAWGPHLHWRELTEGRLT